MTTCHRATYLLVALALATATLRAQERAPATVSQPSGFGIDATEVTRGQYGRWLATAPALEGQAGECAWNTDFTPTCGWPPGADVDLPVVCVDWCDAQAFCRARGGRLCGPADEGERGADGEWLSACRGTPENDSRACNGWTSGPRKLLAAGALRSCRSATGVADMIGNAHEWEDACGGSTGAEDLCRVRGGGFTTADRDLACRAPGAVARRLHAEDIGFRCCSDR